LWADAFNVKLTFGEETYVLPPPTELKEGEFDVKSTQFITYARARGLVSEEVAREGAGYAVGASVAKSNEAKAQRLEEQMVEAVRKMIATK